MHAHSVVGTLPIAIAHLRTVGCIAHDNTTVAFDCKDISQTITHNAPLTWRAEDFALRLREELIEITAFALIKECLALLFAQRIIVTAVFDILRCSIAMSYRTTG